MPSNTTLVVLQPQHSNAKRLKQFRKPAGIPKAKTPVKMSMARPPLTHPVSLRVPLKAPGSLGVDGPFFNLFIRQFQHATLPCDFHPSRQLGHASASRVTQ